MSADQLFFKKIQTQTLHLKINIFWRLEYFMIMLRKKNEGLTRRIL